MASNNAFKDYSDPDFYTEMMGQDPQMAFMSSVSSQFDGTDPMSTRARDSFQGQYSNIYNQYLGKRGQEMKSRTDPAKWTTFSQFLEQQAPYAAQYAALTPQQKGTSTRRFAPSTRFITY